MNHNRAIYLIAFGVLFVTALFVINSAYATSNLPTKVREARADQADIQRWVAKGDYYSKLPASGASFDAKLSREADAARLQALGESFLASNLWARQADAARWQAMGEYYSKLSAPVDNLDAKLSRDTAAARLQALGEAYFGINLQARQADVARWVGLGEYYSEMSSSATSFDAQHTRDVDAARWEGLGKYYADQQSAEAAR